MKTRTDSGHLTTADLVDLCADRGNAVFISDGERQLSYANFRHQVRRVAAAIITPSAVPDNLQRIIRRHRSHRMMSGTAGRSRLLALVLSELSGLLLRFGIIGFDKFEMA